MNLPTIVTHIGAFELRPVKNGQKLEIYLKEDLLGEVFLYFKYGQRFKARYYSTGFLNFVEAGGYTIEEAVSQALFKEELRLEGARKRLKLINNNIRENMTSDTSDTFYREQVKVEGARSRLKILENEIRENRSEPENLAVEAHSYA